VLRFLDVMAYSEQSANRDLAARVLSKWWTSDAIPKDPGD
jgi:hypothetical protein